MNSTLPLVEQASVQKAMAKANVDYLYYSEHEDDSPAVNRDEKTPKGLQNRSQSMNNLLFTSADRKAINSYSRWNDSNT